MTKKQQTTVDVLVEMLENNLGINFQQPLANADQLRYCALETVLEQNRRLIQNHLEEIGQFVKMKLASIEELTSLNTELEARQAVLLKQGERPPIPTETRSPHKDKAV